MAFHNIRSRFFFPECLPIADFTESLFNNEHVDLVSVTFDRVILDSDGLDDLPIKLMNVPELRIKNSIIHNLKESQFDKIRCLEITSSDIFTPYGKSVKIFPNLTQFIVDNRVKHPSILIDPHLSNILEYAFIDVFDFRRFDPIQA